MVYRSAMSLILNGALSYYYGKPQFVPLILPNIYIHIDYNIVSHYSFLEQRINSLFTVHVYVWSATLFCSYKTCLYLNHGINIEHLINRYTK